MAKKDITLSSLTVSLQKYRLFIVKHAAVIFTIAALSLLVYSVSAVNLIINSASDQDYRAQKELETTSTQFDKKTIDKINALGDRQSPPPPVIPSGRTNPFSE